MRRLAILLFALLLACVACGTQESPGVIKGERPAVYTEALLQSGALLDGVRVAGGYILPGWYNQGEGFIQKLDLQGEIIWEKTYPFVHESENNVPRVHEDSGGDGFFVIYDVYSHWNPESNTRVDYPPILARMDAEGNLLWSLEYPGKSDGALSYVLTLPSSDILTMGYNERRRNPGTVAPGDLYISKLSAEGKLLQEKTLSLDEWDYVHMVQCIPGHGIFVFSGSNGHHLALLDENFKVIWDRVPYKHPYVYDDYKGEDDFVTNAAVLGETVFYSYRGNRLRTLNLQKIEHEIKGLPDGMQLLGPVGEHMAVTGTKGVCLLDERGIVALELPVVDWENTPHKHITGGMVIARVLPEQDGYIVVYEKIGESRLTPGSTRSYVPYDIEIIYAGYDAQGQLLWQYAYETIR